MSYQQLTTAELPAAERLDRWIEFGSETLSDMIVLPEGNGAFDARLTRAAVGRLGFVWMETSAATAIGASCNPGRWAAPTGDAHLLRLQDFGQTIIGAGDQATALRPQEMVLRGCSTNWSTRVPHRTGLVTVKIPTELLVSRIGDPDRISGRIFSGSSGAGKVAAAAILAVKQLLLEGEEEDWSDAVEDILISALSLACLSPSSANAEEFPLSSCRERSWRTACQYIDEALADPDLSVAKVSEATGIGMRTLQRLFVTMGESPREYIMARRLDRAMQLLRSGNGQAGKRVTDAAFAVGFNDLSHFSRSFTRRFGRAPSSLVRMQ